MVYQTFFDTTTKKFVKTPGLFDLLGLRNVQICVFFVNNFEKGYFDPIFGLFSAQKGQKDLGFSPIP